VPNNKSLKNATTKVFLHFVLFFLFLFALFGLVCFGEEMRRKGGDDNAIA